MAANKLQGNKLQGNKLQINKNQTHLEVQGLRAIAIIFVLIFHVWPKKVAFGYLGVDTFFVISGYLMCMLMSRKSQINTKTTKDFYFRRLKRILPEYLFVIFVTLIIITQRVSSIEYGQIIEETVQSLFFISNVPVLKEFEYFDLKSRLFYFLHTWSLSAEMQFYLLVPLIFYILNFFDSDTNFKNAFILIVTSLSFFYQYNSIGDQKHMSLLSRIWQFFVGLIAYYLKRKELFAKFSSVIINIVSYGTLFLLVYTLIYGLFNLDEQFNRLIVTILTVLMILIPENTKFLLSLESIQMLGNISYALYLIHWPLFVFHHYYDMEMYRDWRNANEATGWCLIFISALIAYFIEKSFLFVRNLITNWRRLITLIGIFYLLNFSLIHWLKKENIQIDNKFKPTSEWTENALQELEHIWNNPLKTFTLEELTQINANLVRGAYSFYACKNKTKQMPTKFPLRMEHYSNGVTHTCHERGNGTKNIVIVGNSHATHAFIGIQYHFKDLYRSLILFERDSCFPINGFQQIYLTRATRQECLHFINAILPALRKWKEPIDILVVFFAFTDTYDLYEQQHLTINEHLRLLQRFYSALSNLTREVLFIQERTPVFALMPIRDVLSKLKNGQPIDYIGNSKDRMIYRVPILDQQMGAINCSKCIKFDWIKKWCASSDNFCRSTNLHNGLVYFADGHHISPLGSMYQAAEMRHVYDKFVKHGSVN